MNAPSTAVSPQGGVDLTQQSQPLLRGANNGPGPKVQSFLQISAGADAPFRPLVARGMGRKSASPLIKGEDLLNEGGEGEEGGGCCFHGWFLGFEVTGFVEPYQLPALPAVADRDGNWSG